MVVVDPDKHKLVVGMLYTGYSLCLVWMWLDLVGGTQGRQQVPSSHSQWLWYAQPEGVGPGLQLLDVRDDSDSDSTTKW